MPPSEVYRDADTLSRFLGMMSAGRSSIDAIEALKASALATLAGNSGSPLQDRIEAADQPDDMAVTTVADPSQTFKVGDVVALRSDRSVQVPILEVIATGPERRYRVFQNGTKATFYESQLQSIEPANDENEGISLADLHAHLAHCKSSLRLPPTFSRSAQDGFSSFPTSIGRYSSLFVLTVLAY